MESVQDPVEELADLHEMPDVQLVPNNGTTSFIGVMSDKSKTDPKSQAIQTRQFRQALYHALDLDKLVDEASQGRLRKYFCPFVQPWACPEDMPPYEYDPTKHGRSLPRSTGTKAGNLTGCSSAGWNQSEK
jgi:ABC-type transport system substrate-binding protein